MGDFCDNLNFRDLTQEQVLKLSPQYLLKGSISDSRANDELVRLFITTQHPWALLKTIYSNPYIIGGDAKFFERNPLVVKNIFFTPSLDIEQFILSSHSVVSSKILDIALDLDRTKVCSILSSAIKAKIMLHELYYILIKNKSLLAYPEISKEILSLQPSLGLSVSYTERNIWSNTLDMSNSKFFRLYALESLIDSSSYSAETAKQKYQQQNNWNTFFRFYHLPIPLRYQYHLARLLAKPSSSLQLSTNFYFNLKTLDKMFPHGRLNVLNNLRLCFDDWVENYPFSTFVNEDRLNKWLFPCIVKKREDVEKILSCLRRSKVFKEKDKINLQLDLRRAKALEEIAAIEEEAAKETSIKLKTLEEIKECLQPEV